MSFSGLTYLGGRPTKGGTAGTQYIYMLSLLDTLVDTFGFLNLAEMSFTASAIQESFNCTIPLSIFSTFHCFYILSYHSAAVVFH
jgi:hypothetical protein